MMIHNREKELFIRGVINMMKKWFGASLLVLVLALAGCSEEKAKPEAKEKVEKTDNEDQNTTDDLAGQQAEIIKNMEEKAVQLDPKALEADPKAYEEKIIKATGKVLTDNEKGMGSSFEFQVGETKFRVMNFTMGSGFEKGSEVTVFGNVKTGKDAKTGLPLINATYME